MISFLIVEINSIFVIIKHVIRCA